MTIYSLDGLEETLCDENDWSDAIKEEDSTEWDEYANAPASVLANL